MSPNDFMLFILDLDQTLIYADTVVPRRTNFGVGPYYVYRRPHMAVARGRSSPPRGGGRRLGPQSLRAPMRPELFEDCAAGKHSQVLA